MGGKGSGRKKSGKPGTEGEAEKWAKAAEEAAKPAVKAKKQARLPLDEDTETIRIERELATPLMPSALLLAAQSMAAAQQTIERLDKALLDLKAAQHDDRAAAIKDRTQFAREVATGSAWKVVPCREVHQFRTRTVSVFRLDLGDPEEGELVEVRPMTAAELEKATFEPPGVGAERVDLDEPSTGAVH